MAHPLWPLFDLRLRTPRLELRPMTEADALLAAAVLPDDLELDPSAGSYAHLDAGANRGAVSLQSHWRSWGTWAPGSWELQLAVRAEGDLVGTQTLEGEDFPRLRTVDSWSWLVPSARGRGLGTEMRAAVLTLAFGPLEARFAVSSAWHDNHASLGVSRGLGYRPNGEHLHRRGSRVESMVHLRLAREDWSASGRAATVSVDGFDPCRPFFGLPPAG
jgi:RimJ/RimL family protein N-acetyltransferase